MDDIGLLMMWLIIWEISEKNIYTNKAPYKRKTILIKKAKYAIQIILNSVERFKVQKLRGGGGDKCINRK